MDECNKEEKELNEYYKRKKDLDELAKKLMIICEIKAMIVVVSLLVYKSGIFSVFLQNKFISAVYLLICLAVSASSYADLNRILRIKAMNC